MTSRGRILIADDDETFLLSTADILRRDDYDCDCAASASEGASLLRQREYDLVISDIRMPGNTGLEFVRNMPELARGVSVILVTGYPTVETAVQAFCLPVVSYLPKPPDLAELRAVVALAVRRTRFSRTITQAEYELSRWRSELVEVQQAIPLTGEEETLGLTVSTYLGLNLRHIRTSLDNLKRLTEAWVGGRPGEQACQMHDCPRTQTLLDTIVAATEVLQQTKNSFKSKELAELRHRLEAVAGGSSGKTSGG